MIGDESKLRGILNDTDNNNSEDDFFDGTGNKEKPKKNTPVKKKEEDKLKRRSFMIRPSSLKLVYDIQYTLTKENANKGMFKTESQTNVLEKAIKLLHNQIKAEEAPEEFIKNLKS